MHAYDHDLTDDQIKYGAVNHVLYGLAFLFLDLY